ncbi:MAG: glycosyltransferase family 4 protein [Anaerolineae bacterium]
MRILMVSDEIPYPPLSGGLMRVYNLLQRVAREHEVWFVAPADGAEHVDAARQMRSVCQHVEAVPVVRGRPLRHIPGLVRYALAGKPPETRFWCSDALLGRLRSLADTVDFDLVHVEHSHMAPCLEAVRANGSPPAALVMQNVEFETYARIARVERQPLAKARAMLNALWFRHWEPRYAERFDRCAVMSAADRQLLRRANPRLQPDIVPNGVDCRALQPLPPVEGTPSLLFVGTMSYAPCADAAVYLVREVLPRIRRQLPDVELWLVGAAPPPEVQRLGTVPGVHVTGRVPDVGDYYRRSSVCVVPLRAGGGTRLKILEAMALGRPVVSTRLGAEGLDVVDGEHLWLADGADDMARAVLRLLSDRPAYERLVTNGRRLVERQYDWETVAARLLSLYAQTAAGERAGEGDGA